MVTSTFKDTSNIFNFSLIISKLPPLFHSCVFPKCQKTTTYNEFTSLPKDGKNRGIVEKKDLLWY